jgi:hypothetical protein
MSDPTWLDHGRNGVPWSRYGSKRSAGAVLAPTSMWKAARLSKTFIFLQLININSGRS